MTIDPRVGFYLSIVLAVIGVVAAGSTQLTTIFGEHTANIVLAVTMLVLGAGNAVNAILHAIPSGNTPADAAKFALGPPTASAQQAAKTGAILLAIGLGLLMFGQPAFAQSKPGIHAPTGNLVNDAKDLVSPKATPSVAGVALTGNISKDAQAIWNKIVAANGADLAYASALAGAAGTPAGATRKQCWDAIIAANKQASGSSLKNADGTPMVKPDPSLFSDIESFAETVDNLSPQGPLYTSCAGASQLAKMNTLQFINSAVTGVAAFTLTGGLIP